MGDSGVRKYEKQGGSFALSRNGLRIADSKSSTIGTSTSVSEFDDEAENFRSPCQRKLESDAFHSTRVHSSLVGSIIRSQESSGSFSSFDDQREASELVGVRLSLVGLDLRTRESSSDCPRSLDEQRDELHSDLYSPVLETLRVQLRKCVPQLTEDMISRAIINAFADGRYASVWGARPDVYQMEVNHLWRSHEWAHQQKQHEKDTNRELQELLQELLDDIFLHIRCEEFTTSHQVLRVVLAVTAFLGLKINKSVHLPQDTVILQGLPDGTTRQILRQHFSGFGEVTAVAISNHNHGFAFCRFRDEAAALISVAAKSSFAIKGVKVNMSVLQVSQAEKSKHVASNQMHADGVRPTLKAQHVFQSTTALCTVLETRRSQGYTCKTP